MKELAKKIIPSALVRKIQNFLYYTQGTVVISYGGIELLAPRRHILAGVSKDKDSRRDQCIGVAARHTSIHYPECTILDIGANIGDTAAIISAYASNDLILVEASDYFLSYLESNAESIPNKTTVIQAFIYDGFNTSGTLVHWGGTAYFDSKAASRSGFKTLRLDQVADERTKLVKIDADGCDHKIILSATEWLELQKPSLIFEEQIRSTEDLEEAHKTLDALSSIGYSYFVVWDQDGVHLLSTEDFRAVRSLCEELRDIWRNKETSKALHNYEILCIHADDRLIYEGVSSNY
jgi:FkbM family methyltransferase